MRGKTRQLLTGLIRARQDKRFVLVGEGDVGAAGPRDKIRRPDLAQELARGRIDGSWNAARFGALKEIDGRSARLAVDEGVAGYVGEIDVVEEPVRNVA